MMALIRFEGGKTLELTAAWAINQPPNQNGALCRAYGDKGAIEVYTPEGATLYRDFQADGQAKAVPLKPPKVTHQTALLRHFRQCILGEAQPEVGPAQGLLLMQLIDAIYKSADVGRSAEIRVAKKGEIEPEASAIAVS
jgi:predicted dehydrogenase